MYANTKSDLKDKFTFITSESDMPMFFTITHVEQLCTAVITGGFNYQTCEYLSDLLKTMNLKKYEDPNYYDLRIRIKLLCNALDARLSDYSEVDPNLMIMRICGNLEEEEIEILELNKRSDRIQYLRPLSESTISYLINLIIDMRSCSPVLRNMYKLMNALQKISNDGTMNLQKNCSAFAELAYNVCNEFQEVQNAKKTDNLLILNRDHIEDCKTIQRELTAPSRYLISGNQAINDLVGGGFEQARTYSVFALPGEGKSLYLLNLALQIKKYNKEVPTSIDEGTGEPLTPVIYYLSMENSIEETYARTFKMVTGEELSANPKIADEQVKSLLCSGYIDSTPDSPIQIVFDYQADKSVTADYLYRMYDHLKRVYKMEMIMVMADHLGRLLPTKNPRADERLQLGTIANDLHNFATQVKVPVVTNFHLNRSYSQMVSSEPNNRDILMKSSKEHIAESDLIARNIDYGLNAHAATDSNGVKYFGFKLIKARNGSNILNNYDTTRYIPYERYNEIRLVEDIGKNPIFSRTLSKSASYDEVTGEIEIDTSWDPYSGFGRMASESKKLELEAKNTKKKSDEEIQEFIHSSYSSKDDENGLLELKEEMRAEAEAEKAMAKKRVRRIPPIPEVKPRDKSKHELRVKIKPKPTYLNFFNNPAFERGTPEYYARLKEERREKLSSGEMIKAFTFKPIMFRPFQFGYNVYQANPYMYANQTLIKPFLIDVPQPSINNGKKIKAFEFNSDKEFTW